LSYTGLRSTEGSHFHSRLMLLHNRPAIGVMPPTG